jgi:molybdate/tungstate transport system substrate-binding protein
VTDLHRPFDLVVVADADLVPDLMGGSTPSATSYTTFATNEMVLAFTNQSLYADQVTTDNWPTILSKPDVRIGISDPKLDASGYRALMLMMLAENYYKDAGLFNTLAGNHFDPPVHPVWNGTTRTITLAPVLKTDGRLVVRDSSLFLLSLLEAGGIDYAFEYKSVADEHHLRWIPLPTAINLGSQEAIDQYSTVRVDPGVQRFSVIGAERIGTPIVYAATVPSTAPHPAAAADFAAALINATGEGRPNWPTPLSPVEHTL